MTKDEEGGVGCGQWVRGCHNNAVVSLPSVNQGWKGGGGGLQPDASQLKAELPLPSLARAPAPPPRTKPTPNTVRIWMLLLSLLISKRKGG